MYITIQDYYQQAHVTAQFKLSSAGFKYMPQNVRSANALQLCTTLFSYQITMQQYENCLFYRSLQHICGKFYTYHIIGVNDEQLHEVFMTIFVMFFSMKQFPPYQKYIICYFLHIVSISACCCSSPSLILSSISLASIISLAFILIK